MEGYSKSPHGEKIEVLKSMMPEVFDEGKIDFEKLKASLGEEVNFSNERYVLNWAGKSEAFRVMQRPSSATLVPSREESVEFDTTRNIFIEGENMEVLKVLQRSYFGKVKMIYIDPPYNTGNDSFVYPDKFSESKDDYLKRIGDKDVEGYLTREGLFHRNSRENGQYHSNWLNMMMPRLYLAKSLLRDDGVIFISIDDNEVHNLRLLMNEVFGEESFLGCAGRITKKSNNKGDFWAPNFDYILTYAKNREFAREFTGGANVDSYNLIEEDGPRKGEKYQLVRLYMSSIQNQNSEQRFWIECPDGSKVIPPGTTFPPDRPNLGDGIWRWTRTKFENERDKIVIKPVKSSNLLDETFSPAKWNVFTKTYLKDVIENASAKPNSFIEDHINQIASHELNELGIPFDYAKPTTLISYLMGVSQVEKNDIILDYFAGSGTTAHAVMQLNKEDGGNRQFICVQMAEPCDPKSEAYKAGYSNIAEISKERIRRAGAKLRSEAEAERSQKAGELTFEEADQTPMPDFGFKVFRLSDSNFKQWRDIPGSEQDKWQQQSIDFINPVSENATVDNMVYELLLKNGKSLNSTIEHSNNIYNINSGELVLLLESADQATIDHVIILHPQKVIALDNLFSGNDQLKTNTALQLRDAGIEFKTI